jgi:hypothetical protein
MIKGLVIPRLAGSMKPMNWSERIMLSSGEFGKAQDHNKSKEVKMPKSRDPPSVMRAGHRSMAEINSTSLVSGGKHFASKGTTPPSWIAVSSWTDNRAFFALPSVTPDHYVLSTLHLVHNRLFQNEEKVHKAAVKVSRPCAFMHRHVPCIPNYVE